MSASHSPQNDIRRARRARARGQVLLKKGSLDESFKERMEADCYLERARVAGELAAKQTPRLIPSVHEDPIQQIQLEIITRGDPYGFEIQAQVTTFTNQGGDMAALTAVSTAALTLYNMMQSRERSLEITGIHLLESARDPRQTFRKV